MGLLELMAYATDLVAYNMNSQALETIVVTLVVEQNFRNIAQTLDYALKSAIGASGLVTFTLNSSPGMYPFTISHHLQVAAGSGGTQIIFQPTADVAVTYAEASADGFVLSGIPVQAGTESYQEVLGTTNGTQNQTFQLANAFLIDGTLQVSIGAQSYDLSPNSIEDGPTAQIFTIQTDQNGITTLTFGDGVNGIIPPGNQTVLATYYYGGGSATNVAAGTITSIVGDADGSAVSPALLSVTNPTAMTGGADKQTVANAQQNLPLSLKANDRAVTAGDYAALTVEFVAGVLAANAISGPYQGGSFPILLFVVPNGGGNPSAVLANVIASTLLPLKLAGKRIRVLSPVYVNLVIQANAYIQANSPALVVANLLTQVLLNLFALSVVDFGLVYDLQSLYENTDSTVVNGLSRAFYQAFTVMPYAAAHPTVPVVGSAQADYGSYAQGIATNLTLPQSIPVPPNRREWYVQIVTAGGGFTCSRFQVAQRQLGTVTFVTDNLLTDQSANYVPGGLVASDAVLQPNPDESTLNWATAPDGVNTFGITANTQTTISVPMGLLASVEPGDPYVVETQEPTIGKVLRTSLTAGVTSSNTLPVVSSTNFSIGDPVRVWQGMTEFRTTVTNVSSGSIQVAASITIGPAAFVDYLWISEDSSVQFSVVDGTTTPFVPGSDSFYVDTYPLTGDLALRPENFPLLSPTNLSVNPVGGVQ